MNSLAPRCLIGPTRRRPTVPHALWTLLLVLNAACATNPAWARGSACTAAPTCSDTLALHAGGNIHYYRSLPLKQSAAVRRAVIVVHGNKRNADGYYSYAIDAAKLEHRLDDTLVLAPHFPTRADGPAADEHYWSAQGWKIGNKSQDARPVSSFAVIDELLARVCPVGPGIFPNLTTVVIVGHSAGGQFVNRYAAGGTGCPNTAVELRYVVMNPSSYLYVDPRRRPASRAPFEVPHSGCAAYDDYKYGLRHLNAYMARVGPREIRRRLFTRRTWYLAGEADTGAGGSLDQRCEARLQGENRLARHRNYRDYAALFEDWSGATFLTVPGISHSGGEMLSSEAARRITFR